VVPVARGGLVDQARPISPDAEGLVRVALLGAPCGDVWLRVRSPAGALEQVHCEGADPEGRLLSKAPLGGSTSVHCRPR